MCVYILRLSEIQFFVINFDYFPDMISDME